MRVLIVDDDPMALAMLRHSLQKLGHEVLSAADGRELGIVRSSSVRLVVCDWEMPEMSGVELCRTAGRAFGGICVLHLAQLARQFGRHSGGPYRRRGRLHHQAV